MKFEHTKIFNIEGAIRGMRNPLDSWDKSDSYYLDDEFIFGEKDLKLAKNLIKAGKEHRKFLRQIMVCVDITAPRYWWSEFDTYKIGTTSNSCSTMHKLGTYPITIDMFEIDKEFPDDSIYHIIDHLEELRKHYNETKEIKYLRAMKQRLPESFLQKRTVTMNYENIYEFIRQRGHHKLSEWSKATVNWISNLPYIEELGLMEMI
jgi:hypothetical protein